MQEIIWNNVLCVGVLSLVQTKQQQKKDKVKFFLKLV